MNTESEIFLNVSFNNRSLSFLRHRYIDNSSIYTIIILIILIVHYYKYTDLAFLYKKVYSKSLQHSPKLIASKEIQQNA